MRSATPLNFNIAVNVLHLIAVDVSCVKNSQHSFIYTNIEIKSENNENLGVSVDKVQI